METQTRRRIVSDYYEDGTYRWTGEQSIPADGDVHQVWTVAVLAAQARDDLAALDAAIEAVKPYVPHPLYVALSDAATALDVSVRLEAIARMIAMARGMLDFPVAAFLTPPAEAEVVDDKEEAGRYARRQQVIERAQHLIDR